MAAKLSFQSIRAITLQQAFVVMLKACQHDRAPKDVTVQTVISNFGGIIYYKLPELSINELILDIQRKLILRKCQEIGIPYTLFFEGFIKQFNF